MDRTRTISSTAHLARLMSDTSPATRRHGTTRSHLRTLLAPVTTPEPLLPTCEVSKRHDSSTVNRHRRSVAIIGPCKLRPCGDGKRDPASSLGHTRFLDDN